jgi:ketosteroid isomerase-like protein
MAGPPAAPPQVGVIVDKPSLDAKLGANAQSLKKAAIGLADLNDWAAAYTAADLEGLYGFTAEEATLFKSAMSEVPQVTALVDGLQWISKTWGA